MRCQSIEVLIFVRVTNSYLRSVGNEIDGFHQLPHRVVNFLDEIYFHILVTVEISVENIFNLLQIQIRIVLFEMFVVNAQADELRQEGTSKASPNKLSIRGAESTFCLKIANSISSKLHLRQIQFTNRINIFRQSFQQTRSISV